MDASPYLLVGQLGEPSLDQVQPGGADRDEVQVETWVRQRPRLDGRGLVSGVVVQDQMDVQAVGDLLVEFDQELLEPLGPVPAVQRADELAGCDLERVDQ